MPDPASLTIIGAIVGTITGVAGFVLGCVNARRLRQIKSLDLRLELRRQVSDLHTMTEELPDLMQRSKKSRNNVLAAEGLSRTGAFDVWKTSWNSDMVSVRTLDGELPSANDNFKDSKQRDLEDKLVKVHALASRATRLRDKYLEELATDDKTREHIRADARARARSFREGD